MEESASNLSQQSAQDDGVSKEASESVADLKAKLYHEGGGDIRNLVGDRSSINHLQNGVNGTESESRHRSSSKSKEQHSASSSSKHKEGLSSKHHSSGSGSSSHKHSTSSNSYKHKDGNSSSHKHISSSSGSSSKHKEGSSSSSSKHREGSSSSKDKHGERISSKEKHGEDKSGSKEKQGDERLSSAEKQSNSSSSKDKHRESSSSNKDKDKHNSSNSHSKEKEKSSSSSNSTSKHHSSFSSSSDKLKSSSSSRDGDKHKSSSSSSNKHSSSSSSQKDKEKDREKSKEGSSSKYREGSSGNSGEKKEGEKHKGTERPKETGDVEKDKEKSSDKQHSKEEIYVIPKVKEEPKLPVKEECRSQVKDKFVLPGVKIEPKSPVKEERQSQVKDKFVLPGAKIDIKQDPESEDDLPLAQRVNQEKPEKAAKRPAKDDSDDDEPLAGRMEKAKKLKMEEAPSKPVKKRKAEELDDDKPLKKKKKVKKGGKEEKEEPQEGKRKRVKKENEQPEVWKWWEEEKREDGVKWNFLEHRGPVFAPLYEPLPDDISFFYDGKKMKLSLPAEEVGTFYARMLDHDYTTREVFNSNFFKDWRKMMTPQEKSTITDLKKCNFQEMYEYFKAKSEERKNMSKEEKKKIKEQNEAIQKEYGVCFMDGHKEKIGNFKIEPPGLFRGRGDHPKQGMLKMRINPEDVIINCSKDSKIPEPPTGHRWKKILHDNKVTWLASWAENIQGQTKYVMLNAASKLKGEKDWQKYEIARKLHRCVDKIRAQYREDWKSKEMRIRQRAVALYFIDKLALRAGNEKEEGETADTVGCCSLRVEHIKLHDEFDGKEYVVEFDFLGKDSIRYYNTVSVDKRVYKNLKIFMDNKQPGDDLFDRLNTSIMNKHLNHLMEGLTAKVFRTYNASKTLQEQLNLLTNPDDPAPAKLLSYNRANRAVAILCNHQRSVPKNFSKQMENLQIKIDSKKDNIREAKKQLKEAKSNFKASKTPKNKLVYEKKKKAVERLEEQLTKLEVQATDKDENKEIALGTSKLNYLDPRISVAWCKKCNIPLEKIYNKTQRAKFQWAIDMAGPEFEF